MPTIWSIPLLSIIFGVAVLLVAFYTVKIATSERSKRMGALFVVLVLTGIGLIVLGIRLLRLPCADQFGLC